MGTLNSYLVSQRPLSSWCQQSKQEDGGHSGNRSNCRCSSSKQRSGKKLSLLCCVECTLYCVPPMYAKNVRQQCGSVVGKDKFTFKLSQYVNIKPSCLKFTEFFQTYRKTCCQKLAQRDCEEHFVIEIVKSRIIFLEPDWGSTNRAFLYVHCNS